MFDIIQLGQAVLPAEADFTGIIDTATNVFIAAAGLGLSIMAYKWAKSALFRGK
ncbi:MAG: hypothetical protein E1N59_310 [Puniceicoccaceae bacterium 5H]|nr:MAG: hypothetical protein E1N59_310 [Puniceicoccaceae bacterium 5H]